MQVYGGGLEGTPAESGASGQAESFLRRALKTRMPTTLPASAARNDQPRMRSAIAPIESIEACPCHKYQIAETIRATARKRAPIAQPQPSPALRRSIDAGSLERLDG